MTRERAKELLPIIQAYAEGKKVQFKAVGYDGWYDVDDEDGINEGTRYEYRIKPEEDGEITSIEELKEAIFSKKKEIWSKGGNDSLFLDMTISKNMVKDIEKRYECVFRTAKGSVNTFFGIPFVVGDATKVEIRDRFVKLLKKEHTAYRPFKSCDELIETWRNMMNKVLGVSESFIKTDLDEPTVWVKQKIDGRRRMIVGFGENFVEVGNKAKPITLERLFEMYTFFDGSPCGVSNGKEKSDSEN